MLNRITKYCTVTGAIALSYWLLSHLNWLLFKKLGVLPMPIWPAASLALLAAFSFKWGAIPGLALGTILANHLSLNAPLSLALGISVMNSLAPVAGAIILFKTSSLSESFQEIKKPVLTISIALLAVPLCTALGGIGSKAALGLIKPDLIPGAIVRWFMAHMIGTVLITIPYFTWFSRTSTVDNKRRIILARTSYGKRILLYTLIITVTLWIVVSFIKACWFPGRDGSAFLTLFPLKDRYDLIIRLIVTSVIFLGGGIIAKFTLSISKSRARAKEQSQKIQTTLNSISDGVISTDCDGRITGINPAAEQITGFKRKTALGKNFEDIFPTEQEGRLLQIIKMIHDNNREEQNTLEITKKDNTKAIIEFSGTGIIREKGMRKGYVITCRDLTDRIKKDRQLRENEEKLSTLFSSMSEMLVIHDLITDKDGNPVDYRITDCNKAFTKITGIKAEDAIGTLGSVLYQSTPPPYLKEFANVAITGGHYEYSTFFAPMDKHFLISVVHMGKNRFATVTADITAIHKTQEIVKEKNKELENYLYVASHDLRSPLVNIQGFSQRVEKQINDILKIISEIEINQVTRERINALTEKSIPKSLDFIFTNVKKMDTLIKGLLQISRTGRIKMDIREIDMNELIRNTLNSHSYELESIDSRITAEDMPGCYGDKNLLQQLFSNLLTNAVKYRSEDRTLEVTISGKKQFNTCTYTVRDNGTGISPHNLKKIWDVFYRVNPASGIPGEGIGLNIVRRIVEKHQGRIVVESEENRGTAFHITIPNLEFSEEIFSESAFNSRS